MASADSHRLAVLLEPLEPLLPSQRRYRPTRRVRWWLKWLAVGVGIGIALAMVTRGRIFIFPQVVVLAALGALTFSLIARRRVHRLLRRNDDAVAIMRRGHLRDATDRLEALCRDTRRRPPLHSLIVHNLAIARLRLGDPEQALGLLAAVLHGGWLQNRRHAYYIYYPSLLSAVAMSYAVLGNMESARQWQALAATAWPESKQGGMLLLDALLLVRSGEHHLALEQVEREWVDAEANLPPTSMRAIRVLQAFAMTQQTREPYRDAAMDKKVSRLLEAARPFVPGEMDYLAGDWPELRAFLMEHGFVVRDEVLQGSEAAAS